MTEEFKEGAIIELRKYYFFMSDENLLKIAQIMWDIMPRIFVEKSNSGDKK